MPTPVNMPALGESVSEGTVTQWLKKEGESVEVDEPLLEVSTDKVDTEIPSPVAGVLSQILVAEDETVEVGAQIAVIGEAGEAPTEGGAPAVETVEEPPAQEAPAPAPAPAPEPAPAPQPAPRAEPEPQPQPAPAAAAPAETRRSREDITPPVDVETVSATGAATGTGAAKAETEAETEAGGGGEAYVTPLVRKLAAEQGVDLSTVKGSGVGGRIRKQDVQEAARQQQEQRAATAAQPAPPTAAPQPRPVVPDTTLRGRTEQMTRLRQTIAEQMVESQQISAQLTQVIEVDITRVARLREQAAEQFRAREGVELTFLPFFALATIEALKTHPKLNAVIDSAKKEVTYHSVENLGISIDTERGMLAPVIKDAGDLNLGGLARKIVDLTDRAHNGGLSPDELSGGTFTLVDAGADGALFQTPIINQPQVGILATGAVVKRPVVVDDPQLGEVIAVRSVAYLALSYDHRLIDGADAARFMNSVKERLEEGAFEAELG
ncbi:2-oxoglutarate dehydrogenase, E2 component, dihydrolipoamide succinyltransferase [Salinactinospora qingdaonensis]|uniref:Dihydrolipoamide acetyltransferase component of pyruvate dehydrogenase complex n=1 Tax=Salinactinospora qingdaonensis TaxID=702744 RepID=A0ABP7FDX0_9ACTN